jgi:adenylosuccinate lyase
MTFSAISALSPLDGRYAAKLAKLAPYHERTGLYAPARVQVEMAWFIALSDCWV